MAKFNQASKTRTGVTSPIKSTTKTGVTGNGSLGYVRDEKSELFLLAVANFVGKDTFYESAKNRDDRFVRLSQAVAVSDPKWFKSFVGWLRNDAFMRSGSVVAAVEGAKALHDAGVLNGTPRAIVAAAQVRADEPGEVLAYYQSKYGKNFPAYLKKGVADGARKLYNEYSLLKYDTESKGFRFADVIQLSHAKARDEKQNALFSHALDRRYGNVNGIPEELEMIAKRALLMSEFDADEKRALVTSGRVGVTFKEAGMTWEALSGWLQGPMDKAAWESIIPSMGHMALLRNLRNFLQAGVSQGVLRDVLNRISDPAEVAKGKQFPFRYLAAYQANRDNLRVAAALEDALQASLANVPSLSGNTLILVDRSGSMTWTSDKNMGLTFADQAAIFGSALALRAENATLVQFGTSSSEVNFRKDDSVLKMLNKYRDLGGTNTARAIQTHLTQKHDRVIIVTDEQYYGAGPSEVVPKSTPLYTWNLNGYKVGDFSGQSKRHTFGGLTDKAFVQIPLIEAGQQAKWPWEV